MSAQNLGTPYQGHLVFEDDEYESCLKVERFVVRSYGVAFQFKGFDIISDTYETDGVARKTTSGTYVASGVTVKYPGTSSSKATICLRVHETKKGRCQVEGTWQENGGDLLKFSGKLKPFQPTGSP